jgi:hypothetical protein
MPQRRSSLAVHGSLLLLGLLALAVLASLVGPSLFGITVLQHQ